MKCPNNMGKYLPSLYGSEYMIPKKTELWAERLIIGEEKII
jgi:hypothetical protein